MRLLPALDRLSRAAPGGAAVEVVAKAAQAAFVVQVAAPAPEPLARPLMDGLRSAMRRDLGVGAMMSGELAGALVAELHLPSQDATAARPA